MKALTKRKDTRHHKRSVVDEISEKYELTGGSIVNVIRHATLMALRHNEKAINQSALEYSIHRELQKEGGQS